jgi:hypothetical protein
MKTNHAASLTASPYRADRTVVSDADSDGLGPSRGIAIAIMLSMLFWVPAILAFR